MMAVITGGRKVGPSSAMRAWVCSQVRAWSVTSALHGGAPGVDSWAGDLLVALGVSVNVARITREDVAAWGPRAAPLRRNQRMVDRAQASATGAVVLALPGGAGTSDLVARACRAGLRVEFFEPPRQLSLLAD